MAILCLQKKHINLSAPILRKPEEKPMKKTAGRCLLSVGRVQSSHYTPGCRVRQQDKINMMYIYSWHLDSSRNPAEGYIIASRRAVFMYNGSWGGVRHLAAGEARGQLGDGKTKSRLIQTAVH